MPGHENFRWTASSALTCAKPPNPHCARRPNLALVPADYDGDGKADQALYQKKKGKWRFKLSTTGTTSNFTGIGGTGWLATPGDFDGDGKTDAGAYRKSTGGWRYRSSSTGVKTNLPTLGGPGYVPVVGLRP